MMKKMMILTLLTLMITSCQKEEIQPTSKQLNEAEAPLPVPYEPLTLGHSIVDLEKGEDHSDSVYVYHFFDTDQISGELTIEKGNGGIMTIQIMPEDIESTYIPGKNVICYYLKSVVHLTYHELIELDGWFYTTLNLDQYTAYIRNVNYYKGELALRTEFPVYCGINPITTVYQTDDLSTSFWVDINTKATGNDDLK